MGMASPWCFQFSALCFCVLWACAKVPDWLDGLTWSHSPLVHVLWMGWHQGHQPTRDTVILHHHHPQTQEDIVFHTCSTFNHMQSLIMKHNTRLWGVVVYKATALYKTCVLLGTKSRFSLAVKASQPLLLFIFQQTGYVELKTKWNSSLNKAQRLQLPGQTDGWN